MPPYLTYLHYRWVSPPQLVSSLFTLKSYKFFWGSDMSVLLWLIVVVWLVLLGWAAGRLLVLMRR
jgi:hypothetical protein